MSPPEASTNDQVRCPHCAATFTLGNAVEVSLPKLIRVQQQPEESNAIIYDTTEDIAWPLWAELVVDETSIDGTPVEKDHEHIATPAIHVVESEPTDEAPFQTTADPASDHSVTQDTGVLFGFVIEGDEASKICSRQELEFSKSDASRSGEDASQFDLTFDESLLESEETKPVGQDHDMFDFDAESGELGPDEFDIQPQENALGQTRSSLSKPTVERQNTTAVAFSRIGHGRRPSQTQLAMIIGTAGLFLLFILYYTLNFFGGARFDLLGMYLPGCPHTYGLDPNATSMRNETKVAKSDPEQNPKPSQNSRLSDGNTQPSLLQSHTAYRPPGQNHHSDENQADVPDRNPTYKTTEPYQPLSPYYENGLYKHPNLYISGVSFQRERETFELPENEVGLMTHPVFEVRELEATLRTVHELFGCPNCQSTGYIISPDGTEKNKCDLCMGDPANVMSTTCYPYFCQLGQVVSFVKDPSEPAKEVKKQVKELLDKTVTSQQEYHDLAKLVLARLETPLNNTEGIMITGSVRFTEPIKGSNGLYVSNIILPDSDQRVFVVSDHPFDFLADHKVVVLGAVVFDPAENIVGYPKTTTKPWVIWHGASTTLPDKLFE